MGRPKSNPRPTSPRYLKVKRRAMIVRRHRQQLEERGELEPVAEDPVDLVAVIE